MDEECFLLFLIRKFADFLNLTIKFEGVINQNTKIWQRIDVIHRESVLSECEVWWVIEIWTNLE